MERDIDVRDLDGDERRERLFEALDAASTDESVVVTADRDVSPALAQYRIKRDAELDWEYDQSGPDAWVVRASATGPAAGESADALPEFDVRDLPPRRRHDILTDAFDLLDPGEGFVFVNDHDPKPLYHEWQSTHGDAFDWEYASRDDGAWRVEVEKTAATADATAGDVAAAFDVRLIPKEERHPAIHHRYGNLGAGEAMEVVAPHEPKPLHREFSRRYGDAFDWEIREREPGKCRVRITKQSASRDGALDATAELDVRDLPPAQRHERIFEAYAGLDDGEGFVLVNDHDPKPLHHQFEAETGPEFRWEYRARDPGEFRVLIGKADASDPSPTDDLRAPF